MAKISNTRVFEKDCTSLCKSVTHGTIITSAITKRAVTDKQLASYISTLCDNFGQVRDDVGRTALHMAASCGRLDLCYWLLKEGHSDVSARDCEALSTPLHRSLFYGHINVAVLLVKSGANLFAMDSDNLACVDYAMLYNSKLLNGKRHYESEVYIWGSNNNYTHGTGNEQSRQNPERIDTFKKSDISIKQVNLDKFHTIFVGFDGRAWACGHGMGGRLGIDSESTFLTPQLIKIPSYSKIPEKVLSASIGRDHTVLLMDSGAVWTCGLNTYHQLGHTPPPKKLLSPRPLQIQKILKGQPVIGTSASRFHTVLWTLDKVYTFGLHGGQLGHPLTTERTITSPQLVNFSSGTTYIKDVSTSEGATVLAIDNGDIYVLHEYQTRKIFSRMIGITMVGVSGGHLNAKMEPEILTDKGGKELRVVVLTMGGNVHIWSENYPQFTKCLFNLRRDIEITHIHMTYHHLLLGTRDGEGFVGDLLSTTRKKISIPGGNTSQKPPIINNSVIVKVDRVPYLHRTKFITSDPKGRNFAAIQIHPKTAVTKFPVVGPSEMAGNMGTLLMEASDQDSLHDIVFEVSGERFAAHKFILRVRSKLLDILFSKCDMLDCVKPVVKIDKISPLIFYQLLRFIYTGDCDVIHPGPSKIKLVGNKNTDVIKATLEAAKKYKISELVAILQNLKFENSTIIVNKEFLSHIGKAKELSLPRSFNRNSHEDLYNVKIISSDGQTIEAHKCVLAARLEYFHNMLVGGWIETSSNNSLKLQVPFNILEVIVDFLYTDDSPKLRELDFEHICRILIYADQMFIIRLKAICESTLAMFLNLKNASYLMQFASTYRANQLKDCCLQYISANLPAIMEMRTLEAVNVDLLTELSSYYRQFTSIETQYVITPFTDAPTDEAIISACEGFPMTWEDASVTWGDSDSEIVESNSHTKIRNKSTSITPLSLSSSSGKKKRYRKSSTNESQRKPNDSVSSVGDDVAIESVTIDEPPVNEPPLGNEWITVNKTQKAVQARLKVLVKAATVEPTPENFVQLPVSCAININNPSSPPTVASSSSPPSLDNTSLFPQLSNQGHSKHLSSSPKSSNCDVKRSPLAKISQKKRKQLAAEGPASKDVPMVDSQVTSVSAWGQAPSYAPSDSQLSLKNIMKETKEIQCSSEKNISLNGKVPCFSDIIADEMKQKDKLCRMRTKSFQLTQIEDQAMESLRMFYNIDNVFDERITITRVPYGNLATPTWVTTKR